MIFYGKDYHPYTSAPMESTSRKSGGRITLWKMSTLLGKKPRKPPNPQQQIPTGENRVQKPCMNSQDLRQSQSRKSWRRLWIWAQKDGGKEIPVLDLREIQELTDTTPEELTEDDLMEMSASKPVPMSTDTRQTNIRQSGRRVLIIQDSFFISFTWRLHDTHSETKTHGVRWIGTTQKHF